MKMNIINLKNGMKDGIPIGLGYFAVSFTFGILAKKAGLTWFQAVLMSLTNLTSAGQFSALALIGTSSTCLELAFTQLIINLRYCLMSCALSQKMDSKTASIHRFLVAYGITDEIFGVSVCKDGKLKPFYNYGLMSIAIAGWTLGTYVGVVCGNILPERIMSALSITLYGMFIAVIIPPSKGNKTLMGIITLSAALSLLLTKITVYNYISPGFKIITLTVMIAGIAAILFPIKQADEFVSTDCDSSTPVLEEGRC